LWRVLVFFRKLARAMATAAAAWLGAAASPPFASLAGRTCLATVAKGVASRPVWSQRTLSTFAGVRDVEFTVEPIFKDSAGKIPILQLVNEDGNMVDGAKLPFTIDEALGMYKTMVRLSVIDHILNSLQRQGRVSFYMTSNGEEAAGVGSCAALQKQDVVWPQYRELGAFLHRGFSMQQVVDQCMSRLDDPGKGRQMPVHFCASEINMQAVTSPLATQIPQAAGAGYAFRVGGEDRVAVAYFGDGAASEGDFAVALNFAATLRSQTMFLCRNNGWAISTPVKEQYSGDGIAVRGIAYGMRCIRVDGNDLASVYLATQRAREFCIQGEPVIVEMMSYRRGHHSTSDDSARYRSGAEIKSFSRKGLEPISRMRIVLEREGAWDEVRENDFRDAVRDELMDAMKTSEAKKFAALPDMFTDVWAKETQQLEQQKRELFEHLQRHPDKYSERLTKFAKS